MTIPAAKVRLVCTSSEAALVAPSRKPELAPAFKICPGKAAGPSCEKVVDKWQDLGRGQSRAVSRQVGFGDLPANTKLKEQIFREALDSLEARLVKLDASVVSPAKEATRKTKRGRAAGHRSDRTAIRKDLRAAADSLSVHDHNRKRPMANSAATSTSEAKPAPAAIQPATAASKARPRGKAVLPTTVGVKLANFSPFKQQNAITAAKQSRIVRSGKTTRMVGHSSAAANWPLKPAAILGDSRSNSFSIIQRSQMRPPKGCALTEAVHDIADSVRAVDFDGATFAAASSSHPGLLKKSNLLADDSRLSRVS